MNDLIGQSLGRYHILEKLGEGGMAVVYKAYDTHLDCEVAVKVIRTDQVTPAALERTRRRFEREAKEVAKLNHPNIVKVTDFGESDGIPFLAMTYLHGGTLKRLMGKPIAHREAVRLVLPVAGALEYAHQHKMIHRDVKPSNILLTDSGEVMLTDFGIAKMLEVEDGNTLTGTGMGLGTPEYMAPEQWVGQFTPAVDIYALGVVLYEMVTGRKPYIADTPPAVMLKQATEPLPRPRDLAPGLPDALERILFKALARKPEDRYRDMTEFITALRNLGYGENEKTAAAPAARAPAPAEPNATIDLVPPERKQPALQSAKPPSAKRIPASRYLLGGIGIIALAALLAWAGGLFRPGTQADPTPTAAPGTPTSQPLAVTPAEELVLTGPVTINLWTKEGEADGGLQYVQALADTYSAAHPDVTFVVASKEVETLREDFQIASMAAAAPELLWTVSDHLGPFTSADLIQPVDGLVDMGRYVGSASAAVKTPDGRSWGVPISNGNHLMLLYNKSLMPTPPANTDELVSMSRAFVAENPGKYALAFNEAEAFWFVPWLGGFGGRVFAADGITPTLNTPEMIATFKFLANLKALNIMPAESNYDVMSAAFKEGSAAMIINGDWSLGEYKQALGDNLGVAPMPMVVPLNTYPAPYTSGVFFMLPKGLEGDELAAVIDFIKFATSKENQVDMVRKLTRLPALTEALSDPLITTDPILAGSAAQMSYGIAMPNGIQMRCVWDAIKPELLPAYAGAQTAEAAAANAQQAAETCIADILSDLPELTVCEVTDLAGINDRSYNAAAWQGITLATDQLAVSAQYRESKSVEDFTANITAFVAEDCDLIVTVGYMLTDATREAANLNPARKFSIVDASYDPVLTNVVGQVFQQDEAAFLAGYLSAAVTQTGRVGTFGGMQIPTVTMVMDGFARGVAYYNQVHGTSVAALGWDINNQEGLFTNDFSDPQKSADLAESLMDEGADVLLPVVGPVGTGAAAVVKARGKAYFIGVDSDWYLSTPDYADVTLTSVMRNIDVTTFEVIKSARTGTFSGGVFLGTLANGGVGLAPFHAFENTIPAALKAELEAVKAAIISGGIQMNPAFR